MMNINVVHKSNTKKFRSSTQAKQARKAKEDWVAMLAKYDVKPKTKQKAKPSEYKLEIPELRRTKEIPSLNSQHHSTTKSDAPEYTGDAMIGVSVLHKSNGIPVFRKEDIIDVSKMRRG